MPTSFSSNSRRRIVFFRPRCISYRNKFVRILRPILRLVFSDFVISGILFLRIFVKIPCGIWRNFFKKVLAWIFIFEGIVREIISSIDVNISQSFSRVEQKKHQHGFRIISIISQIRSVKYLQRVLSLVPNERSKSIRPSHSHSPLPLSLFLVSSAIPRRKRITIITPIKSLIKPGERIPGVPSFDPPGGGFHGATELNLTEVNVD